MKNACLGTAQYCFFSWSIGVKQIGRSSSEKTFPGKKRFSTLSYV